MNLTRSKLVANERAMLKYRDRDVKILDVRRNLFLKISFEPNKQINFVNRENATVIKLSKAIEITQFYSTEIEFHFIDNLGENSPNIKDFSDENVYDCTTVKWEHGIKPPKNI